MKEQANNKNAKKKGGKTVNKHRSRPKRRGKDKLRDWRKFLKPRIEPRHEEVFRLMFEEKVISMGKAMRMVGYSDSYSKNPNHVAITKSWQRLIGERWPEITGSSD